MGSHPKISLNLLNSVTSIYLENYIAPSFSLNRSTKGILLFKRIMWIPFPTYQPKWSMTLEATTLHNFQILKTWSSHALFLGLISLFLWKYLCTNSIFHHYLEYERRNETIFMSKSKFMIWGSLIDNPLKFLGRKMVFKLSKWNFCSFFFPPFKRNFHNMPPIWQITPLGACKPQPI